MHDARSSASLARHTAAALTSVVFDQEDATAAQRLPGPLESHATPGRIARAHRPWPSAAIPPRSRGGRAPPRWRR